MFRNKYGTLLDNPKKPKSAKGNFASRLDEQSKQIRFARQRRKSRPVKVAAKVVQKQGTGELLLSICPTE